MSDEEMKAEAVALTDEERQYREALKDVDDARENLQKANRELEDWKKKGGGKDDEYRELKQDVMDAKEDLKDAHQRWKDARAMLETANQAIALVNEVRVDAIRKRKTADPHCEVKKSRLDRERESAEHLMSAIRGCNVDQIFDIESILGLPFPSLLAPQDRFQLNMGVFKYQARSNLKPLYDKIVHLVKEDYPITVNVAGTIGYGISYMLAALVLLLLKDPIKYKNGFTPFISPTVDNCWVLTLLL
ncbi:hypothetical protein AC1031_016180 [Aphanomyces cochlioides]|nr:hypothetical protein AC1031_016180 [Aphanomyces cochlioides]